MNCPNCGGKGKYKNGFGKVDSCYYCLGTGKVNDKGERVKTEQEYVQTCNAEQLAEVFMQFMFDAKFKRKFVYGNFYDEFAKWLKQPHTNE